MTNNELKNLRYKDIIYYTYAPTSLNEYNYILECKIIKMNISDSDCSIEVFHNSIGVVGIKPININNFFVDKRLAKLKHVENCRQRVNEVKAQIENLEEILSMVNKSIKEIPFNNDSDKQYYEGLGD